MCGKPATPRKRMGSRERETKHQREKTSTQFFISRQKEKGAEKDFKLVLELKEAKLRRKPVRSKKNWSHPSFEREY